MALKNKKSVAAKGTGKGMPKRATVSNANKGATINARKKQEARYKKADTKSMSPKGTAKAAAKKKGTHKRYAY